MNYCSEHKKKKKSHFFFFVVVKRHTPTNTHIHVINHKNNENTVIIATHPCSCYVTYGPGSSLFFFFIVAVPSIEYPWHGHTHLHHYTMYCISRVLRVYWYVMIWFIIWMCVCYVAVPLETFYFHGCYHSPPQPSQLKTNPIVFSALYPHTHTHHWNLPFLLLLLQLFIIKRKKFG